ncbi:unnamed protein product [Arctogadus glacialis]
MPGKCRFSNAWLRNEKYMSWVSSDKDPGRAKCRLCGDKTLDISNMGEAALTSHAKGTKHQSAAASGAKSNPITGFLTTTARATATANSTSLSLAKQSSITDAVTKKEVLTAEVMCCECNQSIFINVHSLNQTIVSQSFVSFNVYSMPPNSHC